MISVCIIEEEISQLEPGIGPTYIYIQLQLTLML